MAEYLFYDGVTNLFYTLFFLVPLVFFPKTSEVFELNKMVMVYMFTVLIMAFWVIKIIQQKRIIFKRTLLDIPLLLFLGSQFISTIISIDQRTSLFGYYSRFNGGLISTICYSLLYWAFVSNINKENTKKIIKITLISATIVAIYGIFEHFGASFSCIFVSGKFNDSCWVQDIKTRVFATLGQPNWLGAFLISLAPLAWSLALKTKQNKTKLIYIGTSVLFFACILFTKSRSGLLALAVAYFIFWIFNLSKNLKMFMYINILFLIIVAVFGTPITPSISNLFSHQKQAQTIDMSEGGTESGAIRKIVWQGAIDIFKHYPIAGSGVETFGYSYWQFRPIANNNTSEWNFLYNKAHNEYLNLAANTGIIGVGTYLILILTIIFVLRKNPAPLAGFISILITNFFGFSVVTISLFTFLFPALAITINSKLKNDLKLEKLSSQQKIGIGTIIILSGYILVLISRYWYADFLYQKAQIEADAMSWSQSVKAIQEAIKYSPNEAVYHNEMSRIFTTITLELSNKTTQSDAEQILPYAVLESDIAFSLSPRNMNIRETRISMYIELAAFDKNYLENAINLAKDTIPLSPTDPKVELILGQAYANKGDFKNAINSFKKALQLKPDYADAKKDLQIIQKLQK